MNLPGFIAKRISGSNKGGFSGSIHRIAIASVAIGLSIMLISYLILGGFRTTIKNKVFSFAGHLQVTKYTLSNSMEESPVSMDSHFYHHYDSTDFVEHVQVYAHKTGLLKTDEEVQGVLLKGVGNDYDTTIFADNMVEGRFPDVYKEEGYSNEVMLSKRLSQLLELGVGEKVLMYFVQNPPRYRQLEIVGIYETGLEDFDDKILIGDIGLIQRLNDWEDEMVGGYEVFIKDPSKEFEAEEKLFRLVETDQYVTRVSDKYIQLFDWLTLLNKNVSLFLMLILFVACFNMVSVLFIMIMERAQMIGVLKAVGARNRLIRRVFLYNGMRLTMKGMLWGNVLAIGLGLVQYYFKLIPLDPENYYMYYVPIEWDIPVMILMNLLIVVLVTLALILPTMLVTRMKPIKAIRFD